MKNIHKSGLFIVGAVSSLVGIGILFQTLAEWKDRWRNPPPGKIIQAGGLRLHYSDHGQGSPTVILEAGLSCTHLDWSRVMPEVAKITRVVAYDRAGYGWSGPWLKPRTVRQMTEALHSLLVNAGLQGPYILVGHSFGGLLVRLFASQYPEEVAGLVLVDGSPENQREIFEQKMTFCERFMGEVDWQVYRLRPLLARLGILRLRNQPNGVLPTLPEAVKFSATAVGLQSRAYDWVWTEAALVDTINEAVRGSILPQHLRVTLIAAGNSIPDPDKQSLWIDLQQGLAARMPNCTLRIVEGSGHFIHLEKPEPVIEAICQMVDRFRQENQSPR